MWSGLLSTDRSARIRCLSFDSPRFRDAILGCNFRAACGLLALDIILVFGVPNITMKRNHAISLLATLAMLSALAGCRSHGSITGPGAYGTLSGTIIGVIDSVGRYLNDKSGISILLDGRVAAETDEGGIWKIQDAPVGDHTVAYQKAGYRGPKARVVSVVGEAVKQVDNSVFMIGIPHFSTSLALFTPPTLQNNGTVIGSFSSDAPNGVPIAILVLSSRSGDPDLTRHSSFDTSYTVWFGAFASGNTSHTFKFMVPYYGAAFGGVSSGDTITIRVYPYFRLSDDPSRDDSVDVYGYGSGSNVLSAIKP